MSSTPTTRSTTALRLVLIVLGALSAFVAINVAFGGLETLGLQGPTDYVRVTDPAAYAIRDSHARYYGGVYLALGLFLVYASRDLPRFRATLQVVFAMIFAGGLARLSQGDLGVTFGSDLAVSTLIELVGIPALAVWVHRATRPVAVATALPGAGGVVAHAA
ncbi:MAG: DUF4345 domain-containing protein [Acidimicrobiales bacterium]